MSRSDQSFKLRVTDSLKKQIEAAANENKRSMNSEIVARLERTFAADAEGGLGVVSAPTSPAADDHVGKSNNENFARDIRWLKQKIAEHDILLQSNAAGKSEK